MKAKKYDHGISLTIAVMSDHPDAPTNQEILDVLLAELRSGADCQMIDNSEVFDTEDTTEDEGTA